MPRICQGIRQELHSKGGCDGFGLPGRVWGADVRGDTLRGAQEASQGSQLPERRPVQVLATRQWGEWRRLGAGERKRASQRQMRGGLENVLDYKLISCFWFSLFNRSLGGRIH